MEGSYYPSLICLVLGPPSPRRTWRDLERVQQKPTEAARGMENMAYKERLVELGVYCLAQRRPGEDLIVAYNSFKGICKDDKAIFFLGSRRWYIKEQ